ncbi:MAG: hypothetical protein QM482_01500 [Sulfurospirillum sp.]
MERNFLLLTLLLSLTCGSDTFWFSYRSVTLNKTLIYEQKHISPLTVPYSGKSVSTCRIKIEDKKCNSKLNCLNLNFYKILPCFYKSTAKITSQSQVTLKGIKDETELIIVPTRFIVDFKDDFANITILK